MHLRKKQPTFVTIHITQMKDIVFMNNSVVTAFIQISL